MKSFISILSETAYLSETADLLFKRSAYDQSDDFNKYKILKGNVTIISIGREQDGKAEYVCVKDSALLGPCQERYSLRYENETHVSFQMSNVKPEDIGLYVCEAYFGGVKHDPEYEEINFTAKGNVFYE